MKQEHAQRLLIRAVVLAGATALACAWIASRPTLDREALLRVAALVVVTAAAELLTIRLPHGTTGEQISLGEVALALNVVFLPPALAPTVAVAGLVVALIVRRRPLVKIAYNAGQYAVATFVAAASFHSLGGGDVQTSAGLAALFLGMAGFAASNLLTIAAIISTTSGRPLLAVIRDEVGLSLAIALGNSSVGVVGVVLLLERPILAPAILAPALTLHMAYRGWIRQREFTGVIEDQKEKLERIVDHSSEGIVLADASGTVVLWSPSMTRITGVTAEEAEGKAIGYLLRGRSADGSGAVVEIGGEDSVIEVTRADGSSRWLRVQHGPARDPEGTARWDVLLVHDVTREREVEKMKEHFLATVSHELRTPLTPIIGYAKFLIRRDDVTPEIRRESMESLLERAEHMQRLVEDLLLASSVGEDGTPLTMRARREPVDLAEIVERSVVSARVTHTGREIALDSAGPLLVLGDPLRIAQVLSNLVDNAVKYSPAGAPVAVHARREGEEAVLSVTDRGRGIPSDKLEEIFSKFRRLENPDTMETGGAGLGLFIVDQLVNAMGGKVTVDSRLGRGSTFSVRFPVLAGPAAAGDKGVEASA